MNENEKKNLGLNLKDDDDEKRSESLMFNEKDDDDETFGSTSITNYSASNTKSNNYAVTNSTSNSTNGNKFINFVQSLFTNVVDSWSSFDWFSRRTFMPIFSWRQPMMWQSPIWQPQHRTPLNIAPQFVINNYFVGSNENLNTQTSDTFAQSQSYSRTQTSTSSTEIKSITLEGTDNKEVWLSEESTESAINATSTTGSNILAGNNKDNQIFGGSGHNEMWGGNGKTNDYLFGGEGENTFWYGKGEGVDLVENTKAGDTINLYNITLGDISDVEITDSSITLVIGDSEGIGVSTSGEVSPEFKLSDGEKYNYNRTSGAWQKA